MTPLNKLFTIEYGRKEYHNKERLVRAHTGTPLIASGGRNNGIYGLFPIPATKKHIVTVASTGSAGAAFYHGYDCDVSDDALVLTPIEPMTATAMMWVVYMIRANQHRFNYGRKVTPERLGCLSIPMKISKYSKLTLDAVADEVSSDFLDIKEIEAARAIDATLSPTKKRPRLSAVSQIFSIEYGNSYELCNLQRDANGVNFVSRTTRNNGVSARVRRTADEPYPPGCLTVALGSAGGALETFCQLAPFYTGRDVAVLTPLQPMTLEEKLYFCLAIRLHKFRFGFGRQANRTLPSLTISTPPSWVNRCPIAEVQAAIAQDVRQCVATT